MDFWGIDAYYTKINEEKHHLCETCKVRTNIQLPHCQENIKCLKLNLQFLLYENLKYKQELEKYKK